MTITLEPPSPAPTPPPAKKKRTNPLRSFIPVLLVLVGVAVLLYPIFATNWNNHRQREIAREYNNQLTQAAPETLSDGLERARAYNDPLPGVPILDPWLSNAASAPESDAYREYESQLNDFGAMARVRVPRVGIDLPIYHGTSDEVLAKGAGHLYGTSLPVGGEGSHTVLTSHTAFANATLFDHLIDVVEGDVFYIDVYGETLAYEVDQILVVLPDEIGALAPEDDKDLATLFTCTPYAVNTHRLLVRGHRVPYDEQAERSSHGGAELGGFILEPWMYGLLAGAAGGLGLLTLFVVRNRRRAKTAAQHSSVRREAP
ncbi:class C sortase [Enemella sp. A6]|uniref:class C sortase n=1 Tax=Enemella sp. A6 TaxID=3440152 RepID=UPI003EC08703